MEAGKITEKQLEILNYLKQEVLTRGYPPSVREICEAVGLKSTSSVHAHLSSLEKNGYIRRDPTKPRAIEIVDGSLNDFRSEIVQIPVVGQVAAGSPILAEQNIESYFPLTADIIPSHGELFMLRVKGESMINIGIYDGDYLLVSKQTTAKNGEVIVALIDDSTTVKRFFKEDGYYRLQPENDTMSPIIVNDLQIIGKPIGLFRTFNAI